MKLSLETITHNLNLLEEVKKEYPILIDYQKGNINKLSIQNTGLDVFIGLIDYINSCNSKGLKLIYTEPIDYKDLKAKFLELNINAKSKKIFANKSKKDFDELWNNDKLHQRYKKWGNASYAPGLEATEPMIMNYLFQNNIEVYSQYMFFHKDYWFYQHQKPKYYSREMKTTQSFIESFLSYAKEANLDLRKCNIKSVTTELQHKLKQLASIEEGLRVKCIVETTNFTIDNLYIVQSSHINHFGFVEVKLTDDRGETRFIPYSNFEEISRQRDDLLSQLGIK